MRRAAIIAWSLMPTLMVFDGWANTVQDQQDQAESQMPVCPSFDLPSAADQALIERLSRLIQPVIEEQWRGERPGGFTRHRISLDRTHRAVCVDLDESLKPDDLAPVFEERTDRIANEIMEVAYPHGLAGIGFTIGGKALSDLFPEWFRLGDVRRKRSLDQPNILISAGHGLYYHHVFQKWLHQREPSFGVLEDVITPAFARRLGNYVDARSGVRAEMARTDSLERHEASGHPMVAMAARYSIARRLPDRPDIWHSRPGSTDGLTEYKEDISSRPLFANYLGSEAIISLHTNAASADARGIRILYIPSSNQHIQLAENAACYMREALATVPTMASTKVIATPMQARKAELTLARMPALIVEVGFHTNKEDAELLQDYRYQDVTMRGLEKGIRLARQGKSCETFAVAIADSTIPSGKRVPVVPEITGHPTYPLRYSVRATVCPGTLICIPWSGVVYESNPLTLNRACISDRKEPSTMEWEYVFRDDDGVEARATSSTVCLPAS